jgi:adenylate cyclase
MVGDPATPGRRVARRARWVTIAAVLIANAVGAAVVIAFAVLALPKPEGTTDLDTYLVNLALAGAYVLPALAIGTLWGRSRIERSRHGIRGWLEAERAPDPKERALVLRAPRRITLVQAVLWGFAVIVFTGFNLTIDPLLGLGVGLTVALGGITTSAAAYLLSELALRPVAARALEAGPVARRGVPGVATRWLLAWALGTGVPVFGLLLIGIVAVTPVDISERTLGVTVIALCTIGLVFGAVVSTLAAYATVHPLGSLRRGLERVREGDFEVRVGTWDSTEIGTLQAGFNEMVGGLAERERIRDLFGRQVGEDVARRALEGEFGLGGEVREVAVLFVDIVGSTEIAADRPPEDVVALLNRFFAEVVDVVEDAGGWINKFEGDAALAIFGAPLEIEDAQGCALSAARRLDERLRESVGELRAAIGVACGPVVAGPVGAERRYEYTVIGDPVNEAARLTELAKAEPGRVLASSGAVESAREDERERWRLGDAVVLRGRAEATRLAVPGGSPVRGELSANDGH